MHRFRRHVGLGGDVAGDGVQENDSLIAKRRLVVRLQDPYTDLRRADRDDEHRERDEERQREGERQIGLQVEAHGCST